MLCFNLILHEVENGYVDKLHKYDDYMAWWHKSLEFQHRIKEAKSYKPHPTINIHFG